MMKSELSIIVIISTFLLIIFSCGQAKNNEVIIHANAVIIDNFENTANVSITAVNSKPDYIVFGRYCGECVGECATMYKYEVVNNKLFVDHTDSYWKSNNGEPIKFETPVTTVKDLAYAKELSDNLPDFITNIEKTDQRFGCPDCTDGCGLFFEIKKDNAVKKFYIDNQTDKLEGDVRSFAEDLQRMIAKI